MADLRYTYQYYHPMSKNWGLTGGIGPSIKSTDGNEELRLLVYKDIFANHFFKWNITELTYNKKF